MARYIVRPILGAHDKQFSGAEGAGSTVIYTETAAKARELGAAKLGKRPGQVEVIEHDDPSGVFGEDRPLTEDEAREIWNQGAQVDPNSWESV